jgi:putative lipoic acid-binding regulatory protein
MSDSSKEADFYKKLNEQLYDTAKWPSEYLYKFIFTTNVERLDKITGLFNNLGAVITTKESKNGKYTSVSINVSMKSPEAVILKYKEVAKNVDGVISL